MNLPSRLHAAIAALLLLLCFAAPVRAATGTTAAVPPLLLLSLDGFRWDYCALHPQETPNLRALMKEGISARGLVPVYPSNTFPNHYSIVTGLYPSHHGIINNRQYDPRLNAHFRYSERASVQDDRWWGGEPIWITAEKQGRIAACSFWVGSETSIAGRRPTYWKPYDPKLAFAPRADELIGWLTLPPDRRPSIVTFYFEESNSVGHRFGPDAPELVETIRQLDGQIGEIRRRLAEAQVPVNIVVVSDHGMVDTGPDRVVLLDDYLDLQTVQIDFDETSVGLRPRAGNDVERMMAALAKLPPQARAYRAEDLPAHFHIDPANARVPPVWIVPAEGWQVGQRSVFEAVKHRFVRGQHGYDPALPGMHGILIAAGPAFKATGEVIDEVENVHIYNLLCAALKLQPAANDGDERLVRAFLRQ